MSALSVDPRMLVSARLISGVPHHADTIPRHIGVASVLNARARTWSCLRRGGGLANRWLFTGLVGSNPTPAVRFRGPSLMVIVRENPLIYSFAQTV